MILKKKSLIITHLEGIVGKVALKKGRVSRDQVYF